MYAYIRSVIYNIHIYSLWCTYQLHSTSIIACKSHINYCEVKGKTNKKKEEQ